MDVVVIADTIGVAQPHQVTELCSNALQVIEPERLGLHMHDTHERALANCQVERHLDSWPLSLIFGPIILTLTLT